MPFKIGDKVGRLTLTERIGVNKFRQSIFKCNCDCGNVHIISIAGLQKTRSCGCLRKEELPYYCYKHGGKSGGLTKVEYNAWQNMKKRILRPCKKDGPYYSLNQIKICERWVNSFQNFYADMGRRPSHTHSLYRINNLGNYEPHNCRWATRKQQANNKNKLK